MPSQAWLASDNPIVLYFFSRCTSVITTINFISPFLVYREPSHKQRHAVLTVISLLTVLISGTAHEDKHYGRDDLAEIEQCYNS